MRRWFRRLGCRLWGHRWRATYLTSDNPAWRCAFITANCMCPCVRCGELTPSRFIESPHVMVAAPLHVSDWMAYKMVRWADLEARQEEGAA